MAGSFGVWDYVVFAGMLLISAAIGVYYALFTETGQKTSSQFLFGGRNMNAVPVALSLTASFMSAINLLALPAEIYRFGTMLSMMAISYLLTIVFCAETFLPVFYRLRMTSTYEYLEHRFNKFVRRVATVLFLLVTVVYTGIVIYIPALAINQVTGFDLWSAVISTGLVCTFYCAVGGLNAVIWTDVFQIGFLIAGFAAIIARTVTIKGGIGPILDDSYKGGRLIFWDFDPNPVKKYTFWTIVIGAFFQWTCLYGVHQAQVQRYNICKSILHAKMSLYMNLLGLWMILAGAIFCGLCLYSLYRDCDPWTAKLVSAPDQLMPYLAMDILQIYPGLPGLFLASAFSGTLSTVSSSISALATVFIEDFIKPFCSSLSERKLLWISKLMNIFFGGVCIAMAGLASTLGGLLQATSTVTSFLNGPLLGVFALGLFFSFTNAKGAIAGLIIGLTMAFWVMIGSYIYPPLSGSNVPLDLSIEGCNISSMILESNWTATTDQPTLPSADHLPPEDTQERPAIADYWYSLSYVYFSALGTLATLIGGLIVSLLTVGVLRCESDLQDDDISHTRL
ncbi:sodium-coupled monocarboxylate transporter 1-like [Lissotriton helveticus]